MRKVRIVRVLIVTFWLLAAVLVVPWIGMRLTTSGAVSTVTSAPRAKVALVLGAGLNADGTPSNALSPRVKTAVALYKRKRVEKLLMSGDNSVKTYDEVSAMKKLAVSLGVPVNDVLLDYAGFRTLDSCVRVRKVFGQTNIIVVSQRFHLARAIHLCRSFGVEAHGVEAPDVRTFRSRFLSGLREFPASTQAWFDVHGFGTTATYLGAPIDVDNPPAEALEQPLAHENQHR